jgi:hypothetical protein
MHFLPTSFACMCVVLLGARWPLSHRQLCARPCRAQASPTTKNKRGGGGEERWQRQQITRGGRGRRGFAGRKLQSPRMSSNMTHTTASGVGVRLGHHLAAPSLGGASVPARAPPTTALAASSSSLPLRPLFSCEAVRKPRIILSTPRALLPGTLFLKLKLLCLHSLLSCQAPLLRPGQLSGQSRAS